MVESKDGTTQVGGIPVESAAEEMTVGEGSARDPPGKKVVDSPAPACEELDAVANTQPQNHRSNIQTVDTDLAGCLTKSTDDAELIRTRSGNDAIEIQPKSHREMAQKIESLITTFGSSLSEDEKEKQLEQHKQGKGQKNENLDRQKKDHQQERQHIQEDLPFPTDFWARQSRRVARKPCAHFCSSLFIVLALSVIGVQVGKFSVSPQTTGWEARGTLIGKRHTQLMMVQLYADYLLTGGEEAWVDLTTNVQEGWDTREDDDDRITDDGVDKPSRRLETEMTKESIWADHMGNADYSWKDWMTPIHLGDPRLEEGSYQPRVPFLLSETGRDGKPRMARLLQDQLITDQPTVPPTTSPSVAPTDSPTRGPTGSPTRGPTDSPTRGPTDSPTREPTTSPPSAGAMDGPATSPSITDGPATTSPTGKTLSPTIAPTLSPIDEPGRTPTTPVSPPVPRPAPTASPTTASPTTPLSPTSGGVQLLGCDTSFYTGYNMSFIPRLHPVWEIEDGASALDPESIYDICVAEHNTQQVLFENGLCYGCPDDGCLPPFSIVLYARLVVPNGLGMSCEELRDGWAPYQERTETIWKICVEDIKIAIVEEAGATKIRDAGLPDSCPPFFGPTLVDKRFDLTSRVAYTSSVFATREDIAEDMYDVAGAFDRGTSRIKGTYDTQAEDFVDLKISDSLLDDAALAMLSAMISTLALVVHTRSLWLTWVGLLQITISFPLSFFIYKLVAGLNFFPFLNFIGLFVVFALGVDDVFVATDKFKNARIAYPNASTEFVAAKALPDATSAMFLTTITTAVAFFATAVCPVAPIRMFAIFCGLLILFDYLLNILLVFPALCIYDRALQRSLNLGKRPNCLVHFGQIPGRNRDGHSNEQGERVAEGEVNDDDYAENGKLSLIRRIMIGFFNILHETRWGLLAVCIIALGVSGYYASSFRLPEDSAVRLLSERSSFEQNYVNRQELLQDSVDNSGGSFANVVWGLTPADTGDLNDPLTWSQLVLDPSFDPSSEEAQVYLLGFCDVLYASPITARPFANFTCPIQEFDGWLKTQSVSLFPDDIYVEHCREATGVPLPPQVFSPCIIPWVQQRAERRILFRNDKVVAMYIPFASRKRYIVPYDELDKEWHLIEDFIQMQRKLAPPGVDQYYWSSFTYWWYDTNGSMLRTAYSSCAIALFTAAFVILLSSRSFRLTLFSTITIFYVLTSVTATLVALGWSLGFLEAICFAILVGISCDFVIHFSHAYTVKEGAVDKKKRAKYALVTMGPSILAAAFTTVFAAIGMLFCEITFFQKFALVLMFGLIQSTVGAFVFFLTLVVCVGPTEPTKLVDNLLARVCGGKCGGAEADGKHATAEDLSLSDSESSPEQFARLTKKVGVESNTGGVLQLPAYLLSPRPRPNPEEIADAVSVFSVEDDVSTAGENSQRSLFSKSIFTESDWALSIRSA